MTNTATETVVKSAGFSFTLSEIKSAFERVQDSTHWKNPVNEKVRVSFEGWERKKALFEAAVMFYTATEATVTVHRVGQSVDLYVEAPGYYAGPAN